MAKLEKCLPAEKGFLHIDAETRTPQKMSN